MIYAMGSTGIMGLHRALSNVCDLIALRIVQGGHALLPELTYYASRGLALDNFKFLPLFPRNTLTGAP